MRPVLPSQTRAAQTDTSNLSQSCQCIASLHISSCFSIYSPSPSLSISPFPLASWAYVLSVLLYSGEFLGLCRCDPERILQYSSVNLLIFTPGQQSTSSLRFLDCLALPSKLSQIVLLIPGNSSQHDALWQSFTLCM